MDINEYFNKEVKPYVSDAWINESVRDHKDNQIGVVDMKYLSHDTSTNMKRHEVSKQLKRILK